MVRPWPTKVARRTQAERTEATTSALVDAARELFARDGYDATSLDAVAARAGVTKGAVYHHFEGKRQLFEAVFTREVERMATPLAEAYARKKDPWDAFNAACRAFLDECLDPGLQRIVLLDALDRDRLGAGPPAGNPAARNDADRDPAGGRGRPHRTATTGAARHFLLRRALRDRDDRRPRRRPEGRPPPGRQRDQPRPGRLAISA